MERFILFPKNEINLFNEGKKYFSESDYQKAITYFEKAIKIKYLKTDCIKYLIDCHIELHNYDEVYKMIEDEFVDHNVDEEYLLKKYLYTMVLDEQFIEANEIIKIYKQNKAVSNDLERYLDNLLNIIDNKLDDKEVQLMKYLTSDKFEDHIQIILNLERLDYQKYKPEIINFLNKSDIDSFIKYNILKYLIDNNKVQSITYTNYYNKQFIIEKKVFINLLEDKRFNEPIETVSKNLESNYSFAINFVKNIWLDFCIKHYPDLIENIELSCCLLHTLMLKSIEVKFNVNDVCNAYNVNSTTLFRYFDC
ncbi:MAG: Anaphase-promoting complex, cyclosome, subunit 3 [Haloplasmataceae bacterium]|jgi:tetratricopeptide (TPR) repeat protein|nr:Anaphase-promoting complex, cyclosome, subunit 3 [Haloplasmataceae bacterium]